MRDFGKSVRSACSDVGVKTGFVTFRQLELTQLNDIRALVLTKTSWLTKYKEQWPVDWKLKAILNSAKKYKAKSEIQRAAEKEERRVAREALGDDDDEEDEEDEEEEDEEEQEPEGEEE